MTFSRRLADFFRHPVRWLAPVALLALAPKCLLCLAAYAGLGTVLFGGAEICGASSGLPRPWLSVASFLGAALSAGALVRIRARRRPSVATIEQRSVRSSS